MKRRSFLRLIPAATLVPAIVSGAPSQGIKARGIAVIPIGEGHVMIPCPESRRGMEAAASARYRGAFAQAHCLNGEILLMLLQPAPLDMEIAWYLL